MATVPGPKGPTGDLGSVGAKGPTGDASNVVGPKGPIGVPTAAGVWRNTDYNYLAWTFDAFGSQNSAVVTAGNLYCLRVPLREPKTATGIAIYVNVVGSGMVAGQCFAALYDATSRALLAVSADQSAAWQTVGLARAAFVGGPLNLPAGWYYLAFWGQGTTMLNMVRAQYFDCSNLNLPASQYRSMVAAQTITTTPPNPLPVPPPTLRTYLYWAALY